MWAGSPAVRPGGSGHELLRPLGRAGDRDRRGRFVRRRGHDTTPVRAELPRCVHRLPVHRRGRVRAPRLSLDVSGDAGLPARGRAGRVRARLGAGRTAGAGAGRRRVRHHGRGCARARLRHPAHRRAAGAAQRRDRGPVGVVPVRPARRLHRAGERRVRRRVARAAAARPRPAGHGPGRRVGLHRRRRGLAGPAGGPRRRLRGAPGLPLRGLLPRARLARPHRRPARPRPAPGVQRCPGWEGETARGRDAPGT